MLTRAAIRGHRPSKIFIITTGGRLDHTVAGLVLSASVHTWGRWTRWLPQNIVTVTAMLYFVASCAQTTMIHAWGGLNGALSFAAVAGVSAYLEYKSWRLRGLSGHMTKITLQQVAEARSTAGIRPVADLIWITAVAPTPWNLTASQGVWDLAVTSWVWGLYTLTMGRSLPPKPARRRLHLPSLSLPRLPRLVPTR